MSLAPDRPRALRCPCCGHLARHYPFVKPACALHGLLCSRCGRVTQPGEMPDRAQGHRA